MFNINHIQYSSFEMTCWPNVIAVSDAHVKTSDVDQNLKRLHVCLYKYILLKRDKVNSFRQDRDEGCIFLTK